MGSTAGGWETRVVIAREGLAERLTRNWFISFKTPFFRPSGRSPQTDLRISFIHLVSTVDRSPIAAIGTRFLLNDQVVCTLPRLTQGKLISAGQDRFGRALDIPLLLKNVGVYMGRLSESLPGYSNLFPRWVLELDSQEELHATA